MKLLLLIIFTFFLSLGCEKIHEPPPPYDQEEEEHDQGEVEN